MSGVASSAIECRQPREGEWFRVRPGVERRASTLALRDVATGSVYLVARELWPTLGDALTPVCLRAWTNPSGQIFVWPIGLPVLEGGVETLLLSAALIADLAETKWCCLQENPNGPGVIVATEGITQADPEWPPIQFLDILEQAFYGRLITDLDHPVLHQGGVA